MDGRFLAILSQMSSQLGQIVMALEKHNILNEKNLQISTKVLELSGSGEDEKKESVISQNTLDVCLKEIINNKESVEKLRTEMMALNVTTQDTIRELSEKMKAQEEQKEIHACVLKYHKQVCCLDDKLYVCGCPVSSEKPEVTSPPEVGKNA
jgi:hypothetical protein